MEQAIIETEKKYNIVHSWAWLDTLGSDSQDAQRNNPAL
jgi:hypothetical protein